MSDEKTKVQEQLLHIILQNKDSVSDFINAGGKRQHFADQYRMLFDAIVDAEARGVSLTRSSYRMFVQKKGQGTKIQAIAEESLYNRIWGMIGVDSNDMPALMSRQRDAVIDAVVVKEIERYQKSRHKDAVCAAQECVDNIRATIDDVEVGRVATFDTLDDAEFRQRWWDELHHKENSDTPLIKCGISAFDDTMGVGFHPESLVILAADVGGFKSTTMLNIGLNVHALNKVDVLFVPLEMPKFRVYDKIISRASGVPFNKLQTPKGQLTEEDKQRLRDAEKQWDMQGESMGGRFALLDLGINATTSMIRREIEKHMNHHNPALVVVDYLANMSPEKNRYGRNDLEIGDILKDLLGMSKPGQVSNKGFSVVTGAQLGREALKRLRNQKEQSKIVMGSEDIRGSHEYSAYATSIFGFMKDPAQPGSRLHVYPIKNRYGELSYPDGSSRCTLEVRPAVSMIGNLDQGTWGGDQDDNVLTMHAAAVNRITKVVANDDFDL